MLWEQADSGQVDADFQMSDSNQAESTEALGISDSGTKGHGNDGIDRVSEALSTDRSESTGDAPALLSTGLRHVKFSAPKTLFTSFTPLPPPAPELDSTKPHVCGQNPDSTEFPLVATCSDKSSVSTPLYVDEPLGGYDGARVAQVMGGVDMKRKKRAENDFNIWRKRMGSILDSAPSTPKGTREQSHSVFITSSASRFKWGAALQSIAPKRHSFSAPSTPHGQKFSLSEQWRRLLTQTLIPPDCCIEGLVHRQVITGIKSALYVRIVNADALMKPIGKGDLDFTIRSGPGNPLLTVMELEPGELFKFEYSFYISGRYQIALSCRKQRIKESPFTVDVSPCKTSHKFSIGHGLGLHEAKAGRRTCFAIIARDQGGNRRRRGGDAFTVEFNGPAEMRRARVDDNEDGTYEVTYVPTKYGWYDVNLVLQGYVLQECPYRLLVYPGDLSAKQSIIYFNQVLCAVAGEAMDFVVQARDAFGNHLLVGGGVFRGKLRALDQNYFAPIDFQDNDDGTYRGRFVPERACTCRTLIRADAPKGSSNAFCPLCSKLVVKVSPGPAYAPHCVTDVYSDHPNNGVPTHKKAGDWVVFSIVTYDKCGNRKTSGGHRVECKVKVLRPEDTLLNSLKESFCLMSSCKSADKGVPHDESISMMVSKALEKQIEANVEDRGDGCYVVSWKSTKTSLFRAIVTVEGEEIGAKPLCTHIVPAECDPQHCWVAGEV